MDQIWCSLNDKGIFHQLDVVVPGHDNDHKRCLSDKTLWQVHGGPKANKNLAKLRWLTVLEEDLRQ